MIKETKRLEVYLVVHDLIADEQERRVKIAQFRGDNLEEQIAAFVDENPHLRGHLCGTLYVSTTEATGYLL